MEGVSGRVSIHPSIHPIPSHLACLPSVHSPVHPLSLPLSHRYWGLARVVLGVLRRDRRPIDALASPPTVGSRPQKQLPQALCVVVQYGAIVTAFAALQKFTDCLFIEPGRETAEPEQGAALLACRSVSASVANSQLLGMDRGACNAARHCVVMRGSTTYATNTTRWLEYFVQYWSLIPLFPARIALGTLQKGSARPTHSHTGREAVEEELDCRHLPVLQSPVLQFSSSPASSLQISSFPHTPFGDLQGGLC